MLRNTKNHSFPFPSTSNGSGGGGSGSVNPPFGYREIHPHAFAPIDANGARLQDAAFPNSGDVPDVLVFPPAVDTIYELFWPMPTDVDFSNPDIRLRSFYYQRSTTTDLVFVTGFASRRSALSASMDTGAGAAYSTYAKLQHNDRSAFDLMNGSSGLNAQAITLPAPPQGYNTGAKSTASNGLWLRYGRFGTDAEDTDTETIYGIGIQLQYRLAVTNDLTWSN